MKKTFYLIITVAFIACNQQKKQDIPTEKTVKTEIQQKLETYIKVKLTADLSGLSENEKKMIPVFIEIAKIMDDIFWQEAYGNKEEFLSSLADEDYKQYGLINYGPWDRLDGNKSFVTGIGSKPNGANFYPTDMTKAEFEASAIAKTDQQYNLVRRDENGNLINIPYHVAFKKEITKASQLLLQAAELAEDKGLKKYLELRAEALLTDQYQPSDMAWMDMKTNGLDFVVGPIENYEDNLYNYKSAHEAYVLIKDKSWSDRLAKFASFLPELQKGIPAPDTYKQEMPGTDADLNAYDVVYYAGDCNSGGKTIAINLPNDEQVQLAKGSRRLQLKNAMQAKFDKILMPIANVLIKEDQISNIKFDAFFANTMFHEVAHGLGIKNTINGKGTVREALKEHGSALEEGKADILGLYMITQLHEKGEIEGNLNEYYTTFLAGIFRSVRFGAASAHGRANMIRFNFFKEHGAFERDDITGRYSINFEKMQEAMGALSELILTLQGDGDYDGVANLVKEKGVIGDQLQADLDRLSEAGIPVDVVFEQGTEVLGL
ncbi:Zn-dependent hydrolase [Reichenbachiella sp. MALMAid0571]|uniref:dipeptidyl-peptidase 3 family protein n=1 Tax=Reichenbachiella sp. MALMAid0571 TaxID=3143939 RepID=UPI0032DFFC94